MSESLAGKGSCKGKPAECLARGGGIWPAGKAERGRGDPLPHPGHAPTPLRAGAAGAPVARPLQSTAAGGKEPGGPQLTAVGNPIFPISDGANAMAYLWGGGYAHFWRGGLSLRRDWGPPTWRQQLGRHGSCPLSCGNLWALGCGGGWPGGNGPAQSVGLGFRLRFVQGSSRTAFALLASGRSREAEAPARPGFHQSCNLGRCLIALGSPPERTKGSRRAQGSHTREVPGKVTGHPGRVPFPQPSPCPIHLEEGEGSYPSRPAFFSKQLLSLALALWGRGFLALGAWHWGGASPPYLVGQAVSPPHGCPLAGPPPVQVHFRASKRFLLALPPFI